MKVEEDLGCLVHLKSELQFTHALSLWTAMATLTFIQTKSSSQIQEAIGVWEE